MGENESTLKVNNALLYKTKILEEDYKLMIKQMNQIEKIKDLDAVSRL